MAKDHRFRPRVQWYVRPDIARNLIAFQIFKELIEQCWDGDSSKRPTASELLDELHKITADSKSANTCQ